MTDNFIMSFTFFGDKEKGEMVKQTAHPFANEDIKTLWELI